MTLRGLAVMIRLASVTYEGRPSLTILGGDGRLRLLRARDGTTLSPALLADEGEGALKMIEGAEVGEAVGDLNKPLNPPVPRPSKIIGVGMNFEGHAREMKSVARPVYFMKAPSALTGHLNPIELPPYVARPDYEGEVVIVIGRPVKGVSLREARNAIIGFMAGNDVTARELQYDECMPWCLSKSLDTFSPTGPYLVIIDGYEQLEGLCLETYLNGERVQMGCASEMSMSYAEIVANLSRYMKLFPGDLIFTGTPPGVGHARGRYLRDGDVIEVKISSEHPLVNPVKRAQA
ncbi:MAG: fumarylacetoacetate hydrolase family protein [Acidilobus sp.]